MRVTDEMVRIFSEEFHADTAMEYAIAVREALEAALADVPELSAAERAALFVHDRDKERIEQQHRRIAELERRLENALDLAHACACDVRRVLLLALEGQR